MRCFTLMVRLVRLKNLAAFSDVGALDSSPDSDKFRACGVAVETARFGMAVYSAAKHVFGRLFGPLWTLSDFGQSHSGPKSRQRCDGPSSPVAKGRGFWTVTFRTNHTLRDIHRDEPVTGEGCQCPRRGKTEPLAGCYFAPRLRGDGASVDQRTHAGRVCNPRVAKDAAARLARESGGPKGATGCLGWHQSMSTVSLKLPTALWYPETRM
jgi:hypothetical protein